MLISMISKNEYCELEKIIGTEIETWTMEGFARKYEEEWTADSIEKDSDLKGFVTNIIAEIALTLNMKIQQ